MITRILLFVILGMASILAYGEDSTKVVIMLQDVEVKGHAPVVMERGDTLVYNVHSLKLSDGNRLADVLRRLPGIQVDKDGHVMVNGRSVSAIKINGKDFFKGNQKIALHNIPADYVKEVKAYEEESKEARQTGIPDKEKQEVLDVVLEDELENTLSLSGNTGGATHERYNQEWILSDFSRKYSVSLCGSMSNVPQEEDFEESTGLNANKNLGAVLQWSNKEGEEVPGQLSVYTDINYDYVDNDVQKMLRGEQFFSNGQGTYYDESQETNRLKDRNWNTNTSLLWYPDDKNSIQMTFTGSWGNAKSWNSQKSVLYNANHYQWTDVLNPWDNVYGGVPDVRLQNILVNTEDLSTFQKLRSENYHVEAIVTHKFDSLGSALSFKFDYNSNTEHQRLYSFSSIQYWQQGSAPDTEFKNQYSETPSNPYSYGGNLSYSHYFSSNFSIFAKYNFTYSNNSEDRSLYALDSLSDIYAINYPTLGCLPSSYFLALLKDDSKSQYSKCHRNYQGVQIGTSICTGKWTFRPYFTIENRFTRLNFQKATLRSRQKRNDVFFTPSFFMEYKMSPHHWIRLNYYTNALAPNLLNLIDIPDESDPLCVVVGNPNLKDTWQHGVNLWYYSCNLKRQETLTIHPVFHQAFNSLSQKKECDPLTGKQSLQTCNVSGNWDAAVGIEYCRTFGQENPFTLTASSNNTYWHNVGFSSVTGHGDGRNVMNAYSFDEKAEGFLQMHSWELGLSANVNYSHCRNSSVVQNNQNVCITTLKTQVKYEFPWKTIVGTELNFRNRSGFTDALLNGAEWLWNAQLSQSFLRKKNLSVMIRYYDILHQRRNVSYEHSANSYYEITTSNIGSFLMLSIQYNFSLLKGGK